MSHICIATARPETLADFMAALAEAGHAVDCLSTAQAVANAVRDKAPDLCVVDDNLPDCDAFSLVGHLMELNARVTPVVVSSLSDEAFHEVGEGLGILMRLPPGPGRPEAARLLAALKAIA